jgi:chaperonin GroES
LASKKIELTCKGQDLIAGYFSIIISKPYCNATGGLYIPDNAKERPTEGLVMATGPGRVHPETGVQLGCAVKTGDGVIYGKYDGTEMKYNDANHQLIKDDDVLLMYSGSEPTFANAFPVKDQVMR